VYESTGNVEQHKTPESHERPVAPSDIESHVLLETSALGRNLTWSTAYILTISRVLGSGIFATPGVILAAVGSPGLSLLLWVAGAMIAYCGLSVTLEYGCMLPRSGGEKVYLEFTYRKPKYLATVIMATVTLLLGFTASNCLVFARYTVFALELEDTEYMRKALAVGLMTWVTVIHACFMPMGIRIQNFLGWIKIGLIAFMVLSGVFVVLFHSGHPGTENIPALTAAAQPFDWTWTGLWADSIWSWGAIATSVLKVFYSFAGLNNVNNVLNEVKDPVRTLRSVALTALGTACGMYLLVNVAYFLVIPLDEIKSSGELVAALFFERVFGTTVGRRILPSMVALR
jgi:amino acid transporter